MGSKAGNSVQDTTLASNQPRPRAAAHDRVGARTAAYCALAAGLLLLFLAIRGSDWTAPRLTPVLLEFAASLVAAIVGTLALARYYSRRNDTLLLIGAGMLGTAVLDAYHLLVMQRIGLWLAPFDLDATEPWSWFGSRMFLGFILLWSWMAWRSEKRRRPLAPLRIYFEIGSITILTIALFGLLRLPAALRPDLPMPRPMEVLPGLWFAAAAVGYLHKGNWRSRPFEVWLVASLLVGVAIQWLFTPFSTTPLDAWGTVSYALKLVSYLFIFVGLVASMFGLYRQVERSVLVIQHKNEALRAEIVDRKAAEDGARENEEKYRTILETIREGYFEVDLAGNFVFWNDSLARMLGYDPDRMAGLNYRAYTRDGCSHAVFETFSRVYRTGEPVDMFGWEIARPDGSRVVAEASAGPVRGADGEIVGFRGIVRDVTARRTAEERLESKSRELARSNEELRQFAYVASHDLQEPLRLVAGYTRLLASKYEGELDEEARQFIALTLDGVAQMQELIRDLLDYSRVHARPRAFQRTSLERALEGALSKLAPALEESGARVTSDPLPEIHADPAQMGQLFLNLIGNAIKFRSDRPLEIHVGVHGRPGEWHVFVRDNGIGIEPEYRTRVFEMFRRLHRRDEIPGTGIGLAICKRIVERHEGRIWVEPTPGQGATFVVALPREGAGSEAAEATPEGAAEVGTAFDPTTGDQPGRPGAVPDDPSASSPPPPADPVVGEGACIP